MSALNNSLLLGQEGGGGYSISRSLRFNSSDSAYLSRTPASAGNRKTWTLSWWMKRSKLSGTNEFIFGTGGSNTVAQFFFDSSERLRYGEFTGEPFVTAASFRDPSAWYHFVFVFDTTNATSTDRYILYVNGTRATTSTYTAPTQNTDGAWNRNVGHVIGGTADGGSNAPLPSFNGCLADVHLVDGQALTPTSFGEFSATTGVWMPKKYTGTYGTNGFKLDFSDNSAATATTLGKDSSGNGNNWTPNNLSVTAGAGNDSLVDVPTNGSEVDTGSGGQVRGNYCTINPLDQRFTDNGTISNGNLDYSQSSTGSRAARCTIGVSSGKWYWEFTHLGGNASHGISKSTSSLASYPGGADADGWSWFAGGNMYNNGGSVSAYSGLTYTTNDVIGVALNLDAGTLTYYKNGVSQGTAVSGLTGTWFPSFGSSSVAVVSFTANFGQRPFAYTAPSGFKALNTSSLPAPVVTKPSQFFDVSLWTGDNSNSRTISGLGFSPDLVWKKRRTTNGDSHYLVDSVRGDNGGVMRTLFSNQTVAEQDTNSAVELQYGYISGLTSSGFTVAAGTNPSIPRAAVNDSSYAYVAWTWDAGSSTVTNTQGSITSSVRTNNYLSIVTYTGTGSAGTVGHGLGVAPSLIIAKNRDRSIYWSVYHTGSGKDNFLRLNTTDAQTATNVWDNTTPTSTVFSIGADNSVYPLNEKIVAYCFAPVAGYSSFGSYTGNGSSDGSFVYTGFRSRWVMIKRTDTTGGWNIIDTARSAYNVVDTYLYANQSWQENYYGAATYFDILSNGIKFRSSTTAELNASGGTYIYAAFAESCFALNNRAR